MTLGSLKLGSKGATVYCACIGIMENHMDTTIVYWSFIGIMAKELTTTIVY